MKRLQCQVHPVVQPLDILQVQDKIPHLVHGILLSELAGFARDFYTSGPERVLRDNVVLNRSLQDHVKYQLHLVFGGFCSLDTVEQLLNFIRPDVLNRHFAKSREQI